MRLGSPPGRIPRVILRVYQPNRSYTPYNHRSNPVGSVFNHRITKPGRLDRPRFQTGVGSVALAFTGRVQSVSNPPGP